MAESDGQERTEQPTAKRLREAREKGQIPRSRELNTFAALIVAAAAFLTLGSGMLDSLVTLVAEGLTIAPEEVFDLSALFSRLQDTLVRAIIILLPFFALMFLIAIVASVALGGWSFSLSFKPEKMDPIKGFGRLFSWKGLVEMLKGLGKFLLVSGVALLLLRFQGGTFLGLGAEDPLTALEHVGSLLTWGFLILSFALIVVVAIDVPFQLWDHNRQLKMTFQEVKEEHKQTEGSPEVKGRQRQIQREMAQRRMMEEIPTADVVVTNPTHYAVALRYDQENMAAPVVVAKGADLIAMKIRGVASANDVPLVAAPPLARSLYFSTEINEAIPTGLYRAVAQVLAYIYQLQNGSIDRRDDDKALSELPIPESLRRD